MILEIKYVDEKEGTLQLERIVSKRNPQAQVKLLAYKWGGKEILSVHSPSSEIDRNAIYSEKNRHTVWEYVIKNGIPDKHFAPGAFGSRCDDFTILV